MRKITRSKCVLLAVGALTLTLGGIGCSNTSNSATSAHQPAQGTNAAAKAAGGAPSAGVGPSRAGPAGSQ